MGGRGMEAECAAAARAVGTAAVGGLGLPCYLPGRLPRPSHSLPRPRVGRTLQRLQQARVGGVYQAICRRHHLLPADQQGAGAAEGRAAAGKRRRLGGRARRHALHHWWPRAVRGHCVGVVPTTGCIQGQA